MPAQPGVMICGGVAMLLGLLLLPVGQVAGWVAWIFLTYTIETVRLTARVPFASLPVRMDGWMVIAYYAFLGGLTWWLAQPRERRSELWSRFSSRLETRALVSVAAILLALAFFAWRGLPDGRLHVVFLDVGQGDAIFIQTPSGRQVLVDGGPSETVLLSQLGRQMPFWDRTLDVMALTHPESDHVTGLVGVLERYQVDTVIFREMEHESESYVHWLQLLEAEGATVYRGEAGLRLALDAGADASRPVGITVLHPGAELQGNANNDSLVARLTYGQVSVLLTGDIEAEVEQQLVAGGTTLASTVLKAAHHGSCGSTTQEFLEAVAPEVVVISVGADNRFGHPCTEVLERLELVLSAASGEAEAPSLTVEGGAPVYRTDERGAVEFITDGSQVWVKTEK
jgi:competence protein ComEC